MNHRIFFMPLFFLFCFSLVSFTNAYAELVEGKNYTITLTSSAFRPMLVLEDSLGNQLDMDADADEDDSAVIFFSPILDEE